MKESGAKLPDTHLVNPIKALRRSRIANHTTAAPTGAA
jgi:hypothetical protein